MDGTYDFTWHYLTGTDGSVQSIIYGYSGDTGSAVFGLVEAATYEPYGTARHHTRGDINRSGITDTNDIFDFLNTWFASQPAQSVFHSRLVDLTARSAMRDIGSTPRRVFISCATGAMTPLRADGCSGIRLGMSMG